MLRFFPEKRRKWAEIGPISAKLQYLEPLTTLSCTTVVKEVAQLLLNSRF